MTSLPSVYQDFIHQSRYARWLDTEQRRESWVETVDRYVDYLFTRDLPESISTHKQGIRTAILNLDVMPSMRALMTAGPALDSDNVAAYNCAYLPIEGITDFVEAMYISMCGTGVGFSVERQYVSKLPEVPAKFLPGCLIIVEDSRAGWARAFETLLNNLSSGYVPHWDVSAVRPAGAKLKTFGGRASGPGPLVDLFRFCIETFKNAAGRKLNSLEVHDIMCKIGDVVVAGGVRRSAMLSLSNPSDDRMRHAKSGDWSAHPYRRLANISACYTEKPDVGVFMREWTALYESKSGERGIFNREAARAKVLESGRRDPDYEWGTNPCSEIILRPRQFCNLTEVVVRPGDTEDTLGTKVEYATILGTLQSRLTNFPFLRQEWRDNTEEERLLGVSLTGLYDHSYLINSFNTLEWLKNAAIRTNEWASQALGIQPSAAITCVKPSGTVSQLVDCASGIHPRYAPFYIRRVTCSNSDPLTQFMKDHGVASDPDIYNPEANTVFKFYMKSPAYTRHDLNAIDHLECWRTVNECWCEHKPSITVNVKEEEWPEVGAWVWNNFDSISGISFLPWDTGSYQQAPYEECTELEYESNRQHLDLPWDCLRFWEIGDTTRGSTTLACTADACEVVDLT